MPNYIVLRGSTYYYQRAIPEDLQHVLGKKVSRISLQTGNKRFAKRLAKVHATHDTETWTELRQNNHSETIDTDLVRKHCLTFINKRLKEDAQKRLEAYANPDPRQIERRASDLAHQEHWIQELRSSLANPFYPGVDFGDSPAPPVPHVYMTDDADKLIKEARLNIKQDSPAYNLLCHILLEYMVPFQQIILERMKGNAMAEQLLTTTLFGTTANTATAAAPKNEEKQLPTPKEEETPPAPTISEIMEMWIREYNTSPDPRERTVDETRTYVQRFIDFHGDMPVDTVKPSHVREYKDSMLFFPARPTKELREMPLHDQIEFCKCNPDVRTLSNTTVFNKCLSTVKTIFQHAVENSYIENNPAVTFRNKRKHKKKDQRPYNTEDLQQILSFPVFTEKERPKGGGYEAAYWIPLIAMFTGARLEEIGQLLVSNINVEDGIHFFDLRITEVKASGELQKLKNESSKRRVPIHSKLIELGLLKYVEERQEAGDKQLFPHLQEYKGRMTHHFSKWWGRYARKHADFDRTKTFHSFRHAFKDACRECGVNIAHAHRLQGHTTSLEGDDYGDGFSLRVLSEAMEKVSYPLDFSGLQP
ncbi:site-specific integrase [Halodesulfovibrio marinisediminis]|uniref:Site-specific recombinase XerD n=1 Tax=Halodesulfovibrio marinisediminis DSM 17456 TaxID=1121457 RepID=A0A1N6F928_9BACT|nr:site-specific integrase [Halodesulfovibrio marinisediminis]SIN91704.1 Site-specific recombinase XerD [Halodesulfovibrio marinisediminis DSM 17456]